MAVKGTRLGLGLAASICAIALLPAGSAGAAQRAYISETAPPAATAAKIAGFGTTPAGALTPLSPATTSVGTGEGLGGIAITPDAEHLYAIGRAGALYAFTIGATGGLTAVSGSPFAMPTDGLGIAVTPDGRHLYASSGDSVINGFSIAASGALSPVTGSPFTIPDPAFGLAIAPDGRHIYYTSQADEDGVVAGMAIAASGALTPVAGAGGSKTIGPDPFAVSITPDGKNLYAVERDSPGSNIWVFSLAADGTMTQVGLPHLINASSPEPLGSTVTPDGKRLYTANPDDGDVTGFTIGAGGALTDVGSPFALSGAPSTRPYTVVPNSLGTRLYANENNTDDAYSLSIAAGGALTPLAASPVAAVRSDHSGLALTPAQPPVAKLTMTLGGSTANFNASTSTDADSAISGFAWDFGDGQRVAGGSALQTHTYAAPGTYTATVTLTDADGCSTKYVSSGQTPFCNGSGVADASVTVVVKPTADVTPPILQLSGDDSQKVGKTVSVGASCNESCSFDATGKLTVKVKGKKKTFTLGAATGSAGAGATATLKLSLSAKAQKAAKKGKKPKAGISIEGADGAGNTDDATKTVKLTD